MTTLLITFAFAFALGFGLCRFVRGPSFGVGFRAGITRAMKGYQLPDPLLQELALSPEIRDAMAAQQTDREQRIVSYMKAGASYVAAKAAVDAEMEKESTAAVKAMTGEPETASPQTPSSPATDAPKQETS